MSLLKSFFTVSAFTLLSRIFGFVRDILMASILGATVAAEIFLVAFKLPNLFRRLFAEGAFSAAFVPLFAGKISNDGREEALSFSSKVLSILFLSMLVLLLVMEIAMPLVIHVLAPGFVGNANKFEMAVHLCRITFPYLLFISLVAFFAGMLSSVGKFAAQASAPILLNLCLITALLSWNGNALSPGHALSYGVAIAGVLQLLWILVSIRNRSRQC